MSETLSINPTMPIEAVQANGLMNQIRNNAALRFSGLALSSAVVLTGCNSSSAEENDTPKSAASTETVKLKNICGEIDYTKNYADSNFGGPNAVFPNLYKAEGDKRVLFTNENVSKILKTTVSQDYRALAYVKAVFFDTRSEVNNADLSVSNIAKNAQNLIKSYEDNTRNILQDVEEVCNGLAPALIQSTDSFRAPQNLVTEASFIRENGSLAKTGFMPAGAPGVLRGFKLNPNVDAGDDKNKLAAKTELAENAIITEDGKIVLKLVTGPLMFDLDKTAKTTPVDIKVAEGEQIVISPKQDKNEAPTGSKQNNNDQKGDSPRGTNGGTNTNTGSNSGSTGNNGGNAPTGTNGGDAPTGSNGGTETGNNGCGTAGQPECGGGSGSDTGNEGTGTGTGGEGGNGGNEGGEPGGNEPAPSPKPQPTQEPAPKPQPTQEPAPKPQPTKEPEPTQPPKGEEPAPECNPEYTPEGCN